MMARPPGPQTSCIKNTGGGDALYARRRRARKASFFNDLLERRTGKPDRADLARFVRGARDGSAAVFGMSPFIGRRELAGASDRRATGSTGEPGQSETGAFT